jgi:hypothetical protein
MKKSATCLLLWAVEHFTHGAAGIGVSNSFGRTGALRRNADSRPGHHGGSVQAKKFADFL